MANQVDFKILPSDQFNVYSPQTRSEKVITYFTLLSKLRGDILAVSSQDDPNSIVSAYYTNVGNTQTLHLVKADGSEVTASNDYAGTVTSVGVSMPSAFTVTNSPITTSGTIQITGAGTTAQYVRGDGTLATFPDLTGFVPYVGATQNVDLGEYQIKAGQVAFDLTPTGTAGVGIMRWNDQDGTVDLGLLGGNVTLQVGQEQVVRVVNKSGINLTEAGYQAVKITGAQGNRLKVGLAQANNDANSTDTIGLVTENIALNAEGFITSSGLVRNIDTTGALQGETWADGDVIYLSPTTPGAVTKVKPTAPQHTVILGFVVRAHQTQGQIYVKVDNGYELEELHDVAPTPYVNNGVLYRDTATNLWKSATIPTVLGYTPANSTTTISTTAPLSGGGDLSANRTLSISQAGASTDGYLSSTDWNTFNNKASDAFKTIAVTGQSNIVADSPTDTLTFEAGSNIVITTDAANDKITINAIGGGSGSVTSVDMSVPTGFSISGNPITTSGTLALAFASGYSLPTNASQANWDTAYNNSITAFSYNTSTGVLTLTQQDAGTLTATVTLQPFTTDNLTQGSTNLYDKVVSLTGAGTTVVTGTYPNFTITSNDQHVGTVTSIATSAPITGGTITTSGTIGITQSGTAADGYLSSTDWNTFNSKVGGSGTVNYVSKWTSTGAIGNSQIFDSGTYVGINTATPAAKLDISGDHVASIGLLRLNSSASNVAAQTYYIDGVYKAATYAGTDDNFYILGRDADIVFSTTSSTTTRMVITNGGNVGIGTSGPTQKLMVSGSIRVTGGYYDSSNSIGSNGQVLASTGSGTTWINASGGTVNGSGTVNYIPKWTGTTLLADSQLFDNGTNVGIGTATPNRKLTVSGNGTLLGLQSSTAGGYSEMEFTADGVSGAYIFKASSGFSSYAGAGSLNIYNSGAIGFHTASVSNAMFIASATGNIGLGNTGPSQKLHVEGNIRVTGAYYDSLNSAGTSGQILSSTATGTAWISQTNVSGSGTTNYVSKWTSGTAIGNSSIFDNGNVGISTASPSAKLEVSAGVGTPGFNNGIAIVTGNGTYTANHGGILQFQNEDVITAAIRGVRESGWGSGLALYTHNTSSGNTFGTTVVERMRIAESGNVGIGTTAPEKLLHISGGSGNVDNLILQSAYVSAGVGVAMQFNRSSGVLARIRGIEEGSWNGGLLFEVRSGNTYPGYDGATDVAMKIATNGNVGIGTTAPGYKLDVSAAARIYGVRIGRDFSIANRATVRLDSNGDAPADILFGQTAAANQADWTGVYWSISSRNSGAGAAEGNKFTIWRGDAHSAPNNSESQFITITPGLNLGIGETSPTQKLHVSGNVRVTGAYYDSSNAAGTSGQILSSTGTGTAWISPGGGGGIITGSGTTNYVTKWTSGTAVGDSSIFDNGNVGIGTTSPASLLHIYGSGNTFTRYTNTTSAGHYIDVGANGAGQSFIYGYGAYPLLFATNGSEAMRIASGGNVGIGNTNPEAKLHVSGLKSILSNYGVGSSQFFTYEIVTGTSSSTNQTFDMYMGRFGNGYHRVVLWGSGYGTDVGNYFDITRSWGTGSAPRIISNGGLYIGGATYTIHWAAVSYGQYDLFIKWTANMPAGYSNTISYAIQSNTGSGYTQFDYPSGVTVPTLNSSNLVDSVLTAAYNTGNVGIGTTSPSYKLDVRASSSLDAFGLFSGGAGGTKGGIYLGNDGSQYGSLWFDNASNDVVLRQNYSSGNLIFGTNSTERMRITSAGNVGIGTTSPAGKLDVRAGSGGKIIFGSYDANYNVTIEGGDQLNFYNGASATTGYINYNGPGNILISRNLYVEGNSSGGTSGAVRITSAGNVGINETAPSQKLHVSGNIRVTGAYYDSANSAGTSGQILSSTGTGTAWIAAPSGGGVSGSGTTNYVTKWTSGSAVGDSVMYDNGTNVGIGTNGPTSLLHIAGSPQATSGAMITVRDSNANGSNTSFSGIFFNSSPGTDYSIGKLSSGPNGLFQIRNGNNGTGYLTIDNSGNVGIGTTSPFGKLNITRPGINEGAISFDDETSNAHLVLAGSDALVRMQLGTYNNGSYGAWIQASYDNGGTSYGTEPLILNPQGGNVGIGTTAPGYKLDVNGASAFRDTLRLLSGSTNTVNLSWTSTDTGLLNLYHSGNLTTQILANGNSYLNGGNVGIGTTAPDAKLHVDGTVATNSALADVGAYRILKPNGGISSNGGWQTGAIKITYPVGYTYSMHRVKVNVYEYTTNESFTIYFGGYNYAASSEWYNEFAYILSNSGTDRNFTVRFGYDGSKMVVYIGELSSSWAYPQIFIEEVELGYSGHSATWRDGAWGIGFETSAFQNITRTVSDTQATNWARNGSSTYYGFGNVGIGTTAPETKLQVEQTIAGDAGGMLYLKNSTESSGTYTGIYFGTWGRKSGIFHKQGSYGGYGTGDLIFATNSALNGTVVSPSDARMVITSPGNVGIGTTAPANKLDVRGIARVLSDDSITSKILHYTPSPYGMVFRAYGSGANSIQVQREANDAELFPLVLQPNGGNVGIGTTAPLQKLHVVGAVVGGNTGTTGLPNTSGVTTQLAFEARSTQFGNDPSIAYHKEAVYTMYLQGQNSPRGLRLYSPTGESTANFYVQGDVVAFSSSDRRLKDNLSPIPNALEKVSKLTGYEFDWNENQSAYTGHDYGVVAQEVEAVMPELVQTREDGYKAVKYDKIVAVLIEAIKEQQKQIDELKAKLK